MTYSSETSNSAINGLRPEKPQHQKRWSWSLIILGMLTAGGLSWYFLLRNGLEASQQQTRKFPVSLQKAETDLFENSSDFVGTLEAQQRVTLRPEMAARIVEISARSGQFVKAGTPIMQLRLDRSRAQLNAATANVNIQRAARTNAQASLRTAQARLREAEERKESAVAQLERQTAEVALQEAEFKRTQTLVEEGAQSKQELDIQTRNVKTAIASRNSAQKDLNAVQAGVKASSEEVEAARASLDRENAALKQAQFQANVESENLEDTRIVAPVSGVVGDITLKVGDYVNVGQELTTLTLNNTLEVRFSVPSERGSQLRPGLPVELRVKKEEGEPVATGKISFIAPEVDNDAQAITAKATFPNPNGKLRSEQFVRARVIWDRNPAILIPTFAVSRVGNQAFVFVAQTDKDSNSGEVQQVAKQKPVKLGAIQGNSYQVLEGLKGDETIVTSGILNLSDGALIVPESKSSQSKGDS